MIEVAASVYIFEETEITWSKLALLTVSDLNGYLTLQQYP